MHQHETINYIELPAKDLNAAKAFFSQVFQWQFEFFGPDYLAFKEARLEGGFYRADAHSHANKGAALVIFYSSDLEATQAKLIAAGGIISKATFGFPGGKRFHFLDPNNNEFAVWSE
jgi:hypothetical protein